jgi:hypothetical protein
LARLLTQRLFGMSDFLDRLAPVIPRPWQVDTSEPIGAVRLGQQADRLNGIAGGNVHHQAGELDMF